MWVLNSSDWMGTAEATRLTTMITDVKNSTEGGKMKVKGYGEEEESNKFTDIPKHYCRAKKVTVLS